MKKSMVCGVDCLAGDSNCNNYCGHDKTKPMPNSPPEATAEQTLAAAKANAFAARAEAERAWHEYFTLCEVGPEREWAHDVFENIRTATRLN